jgi:hypothetical protein
MTRVRNGILAAGVLALGGAAIWLVFRDGGKSPTAGAEALPVAPGPTPLPVAPPPPAAPAVQQDPLAVAEVPWKAAPAAAGAWSGPTPEADREVLRRIEALRARPLGTRRLAQALAAAAASGDAVAIRMLLRLAEEPGFECQALVALGGVRRPEAQAEVAVRLTSLLASPTNEIRFVAIRSLARVRGDAAVPQVVAFVDRSLNTRDGFEQAAGCAGVAALGEIRSDAGVSALAGLLKGGARPDWLPDFGSEVLATLRRLLAPAPGQPALPEPTIEAVRNAARCYAADLRRKLPGPDNPPGRAYIEAKIRETEELAAR